MKLKKALLVVDVQNDFCPGGRLAVPQGDKIIPILNKYIRVFAQKSLPIFASRDWHPKVSKHFKPYGGVWPAHCIQGAKGAQFHPKLNLPKEAIVLSKGMDPEKDSYSVFQAQDANGTEFLNLLKMFGISELYIGGLATDYCVKYSVLDAMKNDFRVYLLTDAIQGVNLNPRDSQEAVREMVAGGAKTLTLNKFHA